MADRDIVSCPMCLAVYEKRRERRDTKARGSFGCSSCGHKMARWSSFWVLIFTRLDDPVRIYQPSRRSA